MAWGEDASVSLASLPARLAPLYDSVAEDLVPLASTAKGHYLAAIRSQPPRPGIAKITLAADGPHVETEERDRGTVRLLAYLTYMKRVGEKWLVYPAQDYPFLLGLEDEIWSDLPVCHYQKNLKISSDRSILMPDFEILHHNYYATDHDPYPFPAKRNKAIFVGATTGGNNTSGNFLPNPRIEAARFFWTHREAVDFFLPNVVQYDSEETERKIRELPFCDRSFFMSRLDQFRYRYLLSMDGNGATLSRVAMALLSNSVLMKYDSSNIAYYHRWLRPYENFLPIRHHQDVLDLIAKFSDEPDTLRRIIARAHEDFHPLFQPVNVLRYWEIVLNAHLRLMGADEALCEENDRRIQSLDAPLDITVHIANEGDCWVWPSMEAGLAGRGWPIEGISIHSATPLIDTRDIRYQVIDEEGTISPWLRGGHFAGSSGKACRLIAFRARLTGRSAERAALRYGGRAADTGFSVTPDEDGWIVAPRGFETLEFSLAS